MMLQLYFPLLTFIYICLLFDSISRYCASASASASAAPALFPSLSVSSTFVYFWPLTLPENIHARIGIPSFSFKFLLGRLSQLVQALIQTHPSQI